MNLTEINELADQQRAARAAARALAGWLHAEFGDRVEWIRLFGSLARGDWMGPDESDVDVAVVLRGKSGADVDRVITLASEGLRQTGFVLAPRIFSTDEFVRLQQRELRLARDILEEGQVL